MLAALGVFLEDVGTCADRIKARRVLARITRLRLQEELLRIWKTEKITMLLVTHDVEEAIYLSDRIIVMHSGPGRIASDIMVDLPWPRDRASHEFADVRREILRSMDAYAPASAKAA